MLAGRRILVVEDEPMVALLIEDMLSELGCAVVGPAMSLAEGLGLAAVVEIDGALLDINLRGERSFPIADALRARGIPVLFATGYGSGEALQGRSEPVLQKPYPIERLQAALTRLFAAG